MAELSFHEISSNSCFRNSAHRLPPLIRHVPARRRFLGGAVSVPSSSCALPQAELRKGVRISSAITSPSAQMSTGVLRLTPVPVSPENFAPYGTLVLPAEDGEVFGPKDAELDLSKGQPRVYIMRLKDRKLGFDRITHHASVTQCLGSAGGGVWYLGVCPASVVDPPPAGGSSTSKAVQSKAGHWYTPPRPEDVILFRVEGSQILKLHAGTWHAGPLFTDHAMDFFNLELCDTNIVDHTTHVFSEADGVEFIFDP